MSSLKIVLTPRLDCEPADQSIEVCMTFPVSNKSKGDVLFHHVLARGPIKTQQYTAHVVSLQDATGRIPLLSSNSKDARRRTFYAGRDLANGEAVVKYTAVPCDVTEAGPCGPQIALERDGGGLSAAGMSFILRPALDDVFDIIVEWDLSFTPSGTKAACSLGEGTVVSAREKAEVLDECFFIVGPLQSYPTGEEAGSFGMYWLSNPPFDAMALGAKMQALFPRMASFFRDYDPTYRIFIRRNVQKCTSGRGLHRGFVFAWTSIVPRGSDEIDEFLMHETVHNWPRLGHSPGGPTLEEMADGWFNEGIAEYYSLFLPLRFSIFSEEEFVQRLNIRISGYYTNPDRSIKNRDVQSRFWTGGLVNRVPYQRGFMYFLLLAYKLKKAGARSLDELILDMLELRRREQPHGITVWNSMLEKELGPFASSSYQDMSEAVPIILPADCLKVVEGLDWALQRQDQEEFCLGFADSSLSSKGGTVQGLDPASRAAEAGVRKGDITTPRFSFFFVADRWGQNFSMTVKRTGKDNSEEIKELSWSPRSRNKVESYQFTHPSLI